jgi:membrane fusion protein (multidrug efflux system)
MRRWLIINTAVIAGVAALAVAFVDFRRGEPSIGVTGAVKRDEGAAPKDGRKAQRVIAVESAVARAVTASTDFRSIGSLQSDESVQIAAEIAGRVAAITFKEGQSVEAGAELVKLDTALAQAEVSDTQARYTLAQANLDRANALSQTGNVTGKAQDEAVANFEIARAALELAKTRLSKHVITAPFPGRVGIRKVSVGAYIPVGTSIVNLEKIDVLKVDFKLPEMFLPDLSVGQGIEINVDALPGKSFPGEIFAIDPLVDVNGRAIKVRARMDNPGLVLRPGLFARILVKGKQSREVVMVPESAIVPRGGETFVFRIENGKAAETRVRVGERRNGEVEVLEGLLADAAVVTAGQEKLRNGVDVEVVVSGSRDRPAASERRS